MGTLYPSPFTPTPYPYPWGPLADKWLKAEGYRERNREERRDSNPPTKPHSSRSTYLNRKGDEEREPLPHFLRTINVKGVPEPRGPCPSGPTGRTRGAGTGLRGKGEKGLRVKGVGGGREPW